VRKTLLLVFPGFSEFEITVAMAVLRQSAPAEAVSLDGEAVVSEAGLRVAPTSNIGQVAAEDYAGIMLPGGEDLRPVMDDGRVLELVRSFDAAGKPVAAICAGTIVAARAGLLERRPYTTSLYRRYRDVLGCFPEEWLRREPLVQTGNLITAQGFAFVEFGLCLGRALDAISDLPAVAAYYRGHGDLHDEG
jgi:putative intracellular protease/amidase